MPMDMFNVVEFEVVSLTRSAMKFRQHSGYSSCVLPHAVEIRCTENTSSCTMSIILLTLHYTLMRVRHVDV